MRKDGSRLHISLTVSPVRDSDGRIVGASKVARDVTERARQDEALRAANDGLERANADLEQFAHSASHDLQEPLRTVTIYCQLLQRTFQDKLGPTGDEYIGHAVQGAKRMQDLLENLRIYIQVSTTDRERRNEIDAGQVLKNALLSLEAAIKDSGTSVSSAELPLVRMHEFELEQIFQNLIGNAIRYRSNLAPRIHIAAVRQGDEWLFSVQDNGIGIEPQFQEQIFGIFKRLHTVDRNIPAPAWVSRSASGLLSAREDGSGWNRNPEEGRRFILRFPDEMTKARAGRIRVMGRFGFF